MMIQGDPGDNQDFVDRQRVIWHELKPQALETRIVKLLECVMCDSMVELPGDSLKEAIVCSECREVFTKLKDEYLHR